LEYLKDIGDTLGNAQIKVETLWAIAHDISRFFHWLLEFDKSGRKSRQPV
jgi:hypothetical protein